MSLNGVADLYPNTLSGLSSFNATNILLNGQDLTTIFVPFINSPSDVDLSSKNLTTTGRVQTTILKLPSLTNSTSKFLQLDSNKEVISTDLAPIYVAYTGSTANLDMGVYRVFTTSAPASNNELVNKLYVDTTFPTFGFVSSTYAPIANPTFTGTVSGITSAMVGLGNVDNTSDINKPVSTATQTALNLKANLASPTFTGTVSGITKSMVGLGNVDDTSDANKPVSTATQTALNLKSNTASPTFTGTVSLSAVSFTSVPSSGSGTLLAINGTNQLITTTVSINQTATSASGTYYLTFVASSATGAFTPLVFSQIMCDPSVGLIEVNNIKVTSRNQGGGQASLLARDSAGNVIDGTAIVTQTSTSANTDFPVGFIQFAGTGIFTPLNETSGAFTFNPSTLKLKTSKLQITSVPTGTQTFLLAVDSAGNVIQGTGSGGVSSFSGGTTGLLPNTATTGAIVLSGTLSVANGGTGNTTGTLAYLGNTQTFSGVNTFSDQMTLTKGFDLTLGAVNSFVVRNSSLVTQFSVVNTGVTMGNLVLTGNTLNMSNTAGVNTIYSGDSLGISASATTSKNIYMTVAGTALQLDQYGLALGSSTKTFYCNNYEGLSSLGFNMLGGNDSTFKINNTLNISSQPVGFDFQTMYGSFPSYTTNARISGLGIGANTLYSFTGNSLNIDGTNGFVNILTGGTTRATMISTGLVMGSGLSVSTPTLQSLSGGNLVINSAGTTEIQLAGTTVGIFSSTLACLRILNNTIHGNVPCFRIDNYVNDFQYTAIYNATSFTTSSYFQLFQINTTTTVGSIIYNGTTTNYNTTSDRRVKEDIVYDWSGLEVVSKLKPVIYNRNKDKLKRRVHGFIAQDVEEYYPHYVTPPHMADPFYSMDYTCFVPIVTKCIQEQQLQIKAQQTKIEEQSQAINTLTESMKFLTEHLATLTTAFNKIVKE